MRDGRRMASIQVAIRCRYVCGRSTAGDLMAAGGGGGGR
eukprot:COSAG02_NODE_67629_length_252_cov_1.006536_1_plen_38_part_10